jgi:hypothetical protein
MIITQYRCPLLGDLEFRLGKYDILSNKIILFKNGVQKNILSIREIKEPRNAKLIKGKL